MPELVALDLPGGKGFVDALQAVWDTGDAAAPLDPRLPRPAAQALLEALRPTRLVSSDGDISTLRGGRSTEEGDALVMATSGSTGAPRGVVLTHDAVAASARATTAALGADPHEHTWLACLPLAYIGGMSVVTRSIVTGTPVIVQSGFDAATVEQLGREGLVTHVSLVATALRRLEPEVFVTVLLGGAAPPGGLARNVVTTYGMTETGSGVVYDGAPLDGVDVAITPQSEILVRGPMLLREYRDGTSPFVVGTDGSGGWFPTGDGGHLDADGTLHVHGRLAEVIVTGAEKVWPVSVERVLVRHPLVAEVAVWKRPDTRWGERVVAWVVPVDPSAPPSLDELRDAVMGELPRWAAPKELVVTGSLPRSRSGKIRRSLLDV